MYFDLSFIILISFILTFYLLVKSRDMPFFQPHIATDNEKMLLAARKISLFDWPSKMHELKNNRSQNREYWTLACVILSKFFKKNNNDFITILIGLTSNFFSIILIYFIFKNFFNNEMGLLASLIYLTSFWPYHICLFIGHIIYSQMFFLLAILFLQLSNMGNSNYSEFWFFSSGILTMLSFFSSSSSLKYPPLILICLFYTLKNDFSFSLDLSGFYSFDFILLIIPLSLTFFILSSLSQTKFKIEYLKAKKIFFLINISIFFLLVIFRIENECILFILLYFLGALIIFLHITLPIKNFKKNVISILAWLSSTHRSHFNSYTKEAQLKIFQKVLKPNFRGGGLLWNINIFSIFMPLVFPLSIIFLLIFSYYSINDFIKNENFTTIINFSYIIVIGFLPWLIHEVTRGLKVGKAYFACMISFLFFFIFCIFNLNKISLTFMKNYDLSLVQIIYFFCFIQFIFSLKIIIKNVKSRIGVKTLHNFLLKNEIKSFNTYKGKFNEYFVENMLSAFETKFEINYINSIDELKQSNNKVLVVPPITSKTLFFNSNSKTAQHDTFKGDKKLLELIKTKKIEKYCLKKIHTMSSYPYYVYDDEVLSYRKIYLKQINDEDRYFGLGWVLNLNKLWT